MGQTYFGDFKLPEESLYKSIEDTVAARARGEDGRGRMPLEEYSNEVVSKVIEGETGKYWCGDNVEPLKYAIYHVESSIMVSFSFYECLSTGFVG